MLVYDILVINDEQLVCVLMIVFT